MARSGVTAAMLLVAVTMMMANGALAAADDILLSKDGGKGGVSKHDKENKENKGDKENKGKKVPVSPPYAPASPRRRPPSPKASRSPSPEPPSPRRRSPRYPSPSSPRRIRSPPSPRYPSPSSPRRIRSPPSPRYPSYPSSPRPNRRPPSPKREEVKSFLYKKKFIYVVSSDRYDYEQAYNFCVDNGYYMVPYNDKILNEPVPTLCLGDVADGKGCWVGGKQGDLCGYVDPKGDGGVYAHDCKDKQHVVCYTRYWGP